MLTFYWLLNKNHSIGKGCIKLYFQPFGKVNTIWGIELIKINYLFWIANQLLEIVLAQQFISVLPQILCHFLQNRHYISSRRSGSVRLQLGDETRIDEPIRPVPMARLRLSALKEFPQLKPANGVRATFPPVFQCGSLRQSVDPTHDQNAPHQSLAKNHAPKKLHREYQAAP